MNFLLGMPTGIGWGQKQLHHQKAHPIWVMKPENPTTIEISDQLARKTHNPNVFFFFSAVCMARFSTSRTVYFMFSLLGRSPQQYPNFFFPPNMWPSIASCFNMRLKISLTSWRKYSNLERWCNLESRPYRVWDLSSISGTHIVEGGTQFAQGFLWPPYILSDTLIHTYIFTHTNPYMHVWTNTPNKI